MDIGTIISSRLIGSASCRDADNASIRDNRPVVVYATDFRDWTALELSLRSLRHFNPDSIIYVITLCRPSPENSEKIKRAGVVHLDVGELFHSTFPFFRKHGKAYAILTPNGRKTPLESFSRMLVPLIPELVGHKTVLFIDNDVVACGDIRAVFRKSFNRPITVIWSGISFSSMNQRVFRMYQKYDFFGVSRPYTSGGVLMFNLDESILKDHVEIIKRICDSEELIFDNDHDFICEQDAISMYSDYGRTDGKLCIDDFNKMGPISNDTVLYHYWPIKGKPRFMEELRKKLVDGGKDVSWIDESNENRSALSLPFKTALKIFPENMDDKSIMEDFFKHSFVISVNEDSLSEFNSRFAKYTGGIVPTAIKGFTEKELSVKRNISLSHANAVSIASSRGYPYVAVFEEDAYPRSDIASMIPRFMTSIPLDAKLFYLGCVAENMPKRPSKSMFIKPYGKIWGMHAYVVMKSGYEDFLRISKSTMNHVDIAINHGMRSKYMLGDRLFLQLNTVKSKHGHLWYSSLAGFTFCPPEKFYNDEKAEERIRPIRRSRFMNIMSRIGLNGGRKCIIIGSNPSVKKAKLGRYVDCFDGDVIRIDHYPLEDYFGNYGRVVDIIVASDAYEKKLGSSTAMCGKSVVISKKDRREVAKFSPIGTGLMSTGAAFVLIALESYEIVELLGFGDPYVDEPYTYSSVHNPDIMDLSGEMYDSYFLDVEHRFLRKLADGEMKGRLIYHPY